MDKAAELRKGIEEFNRGDYFECHETLEDVWMLEAGEDKQFYQGLIQLSVGFFHLLSHNFRGAESQWEKGIAKLTDYDDEHLGVNLKTLLAKMRRCHETCWKPSERVGRRSLTGRSPRKSSQLGSSAIHRASSVGASFTRDRRSRPGDRSYSRFIISIFNFIGNFYRGRISIVLVIPYESPAT